MVLPNTKDVFSVFDGVYLTSTSLQRKKIRKMEGIFCVDLQWVHTLHRQALAFADK